MTFNGNLLFASPVGKEMFTIMSFFFDFRPLRSIKSSHHSRGIIIRRPFCFSAENVPCDYLTPARVQSRGQREGRMRKFSLHVLLDPSHSIFRCSGTQTTIHAQHDDE